MVVKNRLGDKTPEVYVDILELIENETEHEDYALVELNDDGLMEVFRLHVYHTGSYSGSEFDSIVEHISSIIEENDFPEFEVFEVKGYTGELSIEEAPENSNTYHQVTLKEFSY